MDLEWTTDRSQANQYMPPENVEHSHHSPWRNYKIRIYEQEKQKMLTFVCCDFSNNKVKKNIDY